MIFIKTRYMFKVMRLEILDWIWIIDVLSRILKSLEFFKAFSGILEASLESRLFDQLILFKGILSLRLLSVETQINVRS